jgi:uncharacterized protein (TIGR03067 family)
MNERTDGHPEPNVLVDFGLGKLDVTESSLIEVHLSKCQDCCETLLNLKDDTFTGLVRSLPEPLLESLPEVTRTDSPEETEPGNAAGNSPRGAELTGGAVVDNQSSHAETMLERSGEPAEPSRLPEELQDHRRYRIVEQIGKGGMGDVYRAEHTLMNRSVAIKLINSQLVKHPLAVERFRREVQAAAQLNHPNIVTAFDAEQAGDVHFLVMEFVEGTDLATVIQDRGALPIDEACDCIRQAARGLQHAHEKGLVHRDIKPHNLMLVGRAADAGETGGRRAIEPGATEDVCTPETRPTVKILDFGLASFATESAIIEADSTDENDGHTTPLHLTSFGSVMGTPDYIAPEQAQDAHSADIRADIYSLGCTLYFLLSGKTPHAGDSVVEKLRAHAERDPEPIEAVRVDVPDELAEVIRRMMARNPAERFQTPAEVADALADFVDQHRTDSEGGRGESGDSLPAATAEPMRFGLRVLSLAGILSVVAAILAITNRGWIAFQYPEWIAPWLRLGGMASLPVGLVVLLGAFRMKQRTSYQLVVSAVLLSMLPVNPAAIAMLPLTVWLLSLIRRPEIRAMFQPDGLASLPSTAISKPGLRLACLALSALIGAGLLGTLIHFDTDHGELIIEIDDPSLVVRIERDGRLMRIEDEGGLRVTFLPSGEYDIKVLGAREDTVSISKSRVQISRGGKQFITIRHENAVAKTTDQQRIQGTWIAESGELGGQSTPYELIGLQRAVFDGDKLSVVMSGGLTGEGVFDLKTLEEPKQIWLQVKGESGGMRGIYKLEGDQLTLCMNQDRKGKLAAEFVSPAGTMVDLIVLRRETPGRKPVAEISERPADDRKARPKKTGILTSPPQVPPAGLPTGRNLITDPSLEDTATGRLPQSWSAWRDDGPDFKCEVVEGGATGKHCLQISGTGIRGVVFCTSIPLDRSKRFALKGSVRVEGEAGTWAVIKLNYFNKSGWLGVDDRVGVTTSDVDWQFFEKTDISDRYPTATLIVPTCHIEGNGTAWFDDLEVIAWDRDKLPADFDATHGKNNRMK